MQAGVEACGESETLLQPEPAWYATLPVMMLQYWCDTVPFPDQSFRFQVIWNRAVMHGPGNSAFLHFNCNFKIDFQIMQC